MPFDLVKRLMPRARAQRQTLQGRFQAYNHTLPNRYPWLFAAAASHMSAVADPVLLSFGCSRGDEALSLRQYFPRASIKGIDVDPQNIAACSRRARLEGCSDMTFETACDTQAERSESYHAIFCLAVLCLGDLTVKRMERCDPLLRFVDFERVVTDFARCLKPGGYLWLHTSNFRFADTAIASSFDVVLEAELQQMAPDLQFGRDNRLLTGERSRAVGFRKRA
jgi:tRNA G46 methylase TrmB